MLRRLFLLAVLLTLTVPAVAGQGSPAPDDAPVKEDYRATPWFGGPPPHRDAAEPNIPAEAEPPPATAILPDEEAGVIRFMLKGREAAILDGTGLHVRDGITYGGNINSTGAVGDATEPSDNDAAGGGR